MLALYVAVGDTPWGYGLVKFDKDNNVLWKYLAHVHHDLTVAPDGRIFVLTQEIGQDDLPQYPHLKAPRIDDYIAVLSPDGHELNKIRIIDSLLRSPYSRLVDTVPWYIQKGAGDYLHTNSIEYLDGTTAQKLPEAEEGRLLLSFREIGTLAIFDPATGEIVWTMRGPWLRQHDPDLLANGNILLFDNQGNFGPGGMTRVIEVDPEVASNRLDLCRHTAGAVRERGPFLAGSPRQRQHADHRVRRRAVARGHPERPDRLELRQSGAGTARRRRDGDPDRLVGRADRPRIVGTRGAVTAAGIGHDLAGSAQRLIADRGRSSPDERDRRRADCGIAASLKIRRRSHVL